MRSLWKFLVPLAAVPAVVLPFQATRAFAGTPPPQKHYALVTIFTQVGPVADSGTISQASPRTRGLFYYTCIFKRQPPLCQVMFTFTSPDYGVLNATFVIRGSGNYVQGPITGGTGRFAGATGEFAHYVTGPHNRGITTLDIYTF
jgi:hypothetical protein